MGVFNSIYFECPECEEEMDILHSKANRSMETYTVGVDPIPPIVAADLHGDKLTCGNCGCVRYVQAKVKLKLKKKCPKKKDCTHDS